jgi:protein TonB
MIAVGSCRQPEASIMDVAQGRPRSWTPHIVLFSLVLHAVVIYYIAVALRIVPPIIEPSEPPVIRTVTFTPQPPAVEPDKITPKRLPIPQRLPKAPPIPTTVAPTVLPPTVGPAPSGPVAIDVRDQIQEQPVAQPLPGYPRMAQERGIEGRVIMSITIMPDGSVRDVRVIEAQPRGVFETAAVRAVQRWRYRPSGVIRTNVIVHMDFELKDA